MWEIQERRVQSLGQEDPLKKEMATHSSILAWKPQWTKEPGGLESMGSQRVGHHWAHTQTHTQSEYIWLFLSIYFQQCFIFGIIYLASMVVHMYTLVVMYSRHMCFVIFIIHIQSMRYLYTKCYARLICYTQTHFPPSLWIYFNFLKSFILGGSFMVHACHVISNKYWSTSTSLCLFLLFLGFSQQKYWNN